jgi:hypothetical protein
MSNTIEFQEAREVQAHSQKPLDETVWRVWLEKIFFRKDSVEPPASKP